MRRSTIVLFFALLATATASAAAAAPRFAGNVCRLLTAKQAAAVPGLSSRCTNAKPSRGFGSTIYVGNWAAKSGTTPTLQVTVSRYTDAGALRLAKQNLKQGLVATPRQVTGIGSAAYEAVGPSSAEVRFLTGNFVVNVILSTRGRPRSAASVEALARAVAGEL